MKRSVFFAMAVSLWALSAVGVKAAVRLPGFFGDNMVIQRERPVRIWGWADRNETVEVDFNGEHRATKADRGGRWEVLFAPMPHGGPYTLTVTGKGNTVELSNILVGDVWLCSGQSNMEWTVSMANNAAAEIAAADYPGIRTLNIPNIIHRLPQDDLTAKWVVCTPETAGDFSAVAYYYAREVHRVMGIPVGIINASWGGTAIEAWTSSDSYISLPEAVRIDFDDELIAELDKYLAKNRGDMKGYMEQRMGDRGIKEKWYSADTDDTVWERMELPRDWDGSPLGAVDGIVWFRRTFELPASAAGMPATLHLGRIDDNEITWVNGTEVGHTNGHSAHRIYDVPAGVLKPGRNTVAVRVTDELSMGGFMSSPDAMYLELGGGAARVPLAGEWRYFPTVVNEDFYSRYIGPNTIYSLAYNAMVNPLEKLAIKGVIWYQGENNTPRAYSYRTLFANLIHDWREKWDDDFPVYWVQLPNFMGKDELPSESDWAELREAQDMALSIPGTGQAVTIDIGLGHDLHPGNKQDVGKRLALLALDKTYGMEVVSSGPTFRSMERKGSAFVLEFDLHGSAAWEVRNRYGYIEGFAIAGADRRFVWAKALLKDDRIIVWSEQVAEPVAVRYAWGNNPDINLFNAEGLPAAPFRTDDWKGITE